MATLDVEALLDATASKNDEVKETQARESVEREKSERSDRRDRDRSSDRGRRDRSPRRRSSDRSRRDRADDREATPRSDAGSHKSRRRSRSRDDDRRHSRRHRGDGDYYRSGRGGRDRSRSRSPRRHYRPRDDHRDRDDRGHYRSRDDDRHRGGRTPKRDATPVLTEDERDRRTVFVQQLAARLRTKELKEFFEKVGPVTEAQIVKDRISGRSKGFVTSSPTPFLLVVMLPFLTCTITHANNWYRVGYVEFKKEESVTAALQLTGQKLLGIPVIVQLTEAEKNRQVRTTDGSGQGNSVPFHRLYVGNIHFSITEQDLQTVFEPFGELEFVQLQKDDAGRSRGYGFVQ